MEERIFMFNVHATFRCCSLELGKCCRDYMSLKHLWDNVKMETAGSSYKIGENFTQEVPIPWSNKVRLVNMDSDLIDVVALFEAKKVHEIQFYVHYSNFSTKTKAQTLPNQLSNTQPNPLPNIEPNQLLCTQQK
ncbi:hypothetical protein ACOSQ2_027294 [Xanthoceras sorbifolium]